MKSKIENNYKQEKKYLLNFYINKIKLGGGGNSNKKAVSLMISYVLLIAIVIGLAIGVYAWLKVLSNITPATDCQQGTSLILEQEKCLPGGLQLDLKNNGRFNIDGVIVAVGPDSKLTPTTFLIPEELGGIIPGHYYFPEPISPGQTGYGVFINKEKIGDSEPTKITFEDIAIIQIQPFIIDKGQRVVCQNAVITQEVTGCLMTDLPQ